MKFHCRLHQHEMDLDPTTLVRIGKNTGRKFQLVLVDGTAHEIRKIQPSDKEKEPEVIVVLKKEDPPIPVEPDPVEATILPIAIETPRVARIIEPQRPSPPPERDHYSRILPELPGPDYVLGRITKWNNQYNDGFVRTYDEFKTPSLHYLVVSIRDVVTEGTMRTGTLIAYKAAPPDDWRMYDMPRAKSIHIYAEDGGEETT